MTQQLVVQVLIFLGVMVAVTVLPAIFIIGVVMLMKAWMSPQRSPATSARPAAPTDEELETQT